MSDRSVSSPRAGIEARRFGFRYASAAEAAVSEVSFELEPGGCLLVVGPSGSGKSTLALALAGIVPHEIPGEWRGSLSVAGIEVERGPRARLAEQVGVVFQDPGSQLVMDEVEDDVAFGLENRGWAPAAMRERVPAVLADLGLSSLARRRPTTLSGGQQQRLALAGVLAPRPSVLVLDEPTANLDEPSTARLFDELRALRQARVATIVLVEHRVERAWPLADLVLALGRDGRPLDVGPPGVVLARSGEAMRAAGIWLPGEEVPSRAPAPVAQRGGEPIAVARSVDFAYRRGTDVLSGFDLDVAPGERLALVGPNGSGKSTLGRLLVGLLRPGSGEVRLAGEDPSRLSSRKLARLAGYVFQDPEQQFLARTVRSEVLLGLDDTDRAAAPALMARLGLPLEAFGERSPYRLSGGEQRRLSLASMLVRRPRLLVLDEPTFGQDRDGFEALTSILRDRVETGTAVIAATHDERFVSAFAERVVRLG